jgi:uncharacterized protein (DUF3084 family)
MSLEVFLILLVLVLSGAIATLGDRIGTKVGKARLSLFNLRPKKTAVLVTIITGMLISASTMGLLLLVSRGIRDRLLNFDKIRRGFRQDVELAQTQLGKANIELEKANADKVQVQNQLNQVKLERERVQVQLGRINTSLKGAVDRQRQTEFLRQQVEQQRNQIQGQLIRVSDQAIALKSDIGRLVTDRQILLQQRNQVAQQIAQRDQEISRRNQELARRDQLVQQRNQSIAIRDQVIVKRENRLKELEEQQNFLQNELTQLQQVAIDSQALLRVGVPTIVRDQALALAVVQAQGPSQARIAVDAVLTKANLLAFQRIEPPGIKPDVPILQIEPTEVERLIARISDGAPYVVRVIAAANYLRGEPLNDRRGIRVFIQVAPNRTIFPANAMVMTQSIRDPGRQTPEELQEWLTQLISQANFYARQQGIWASTSNVRFPSAEAVVQKLRQSDVPTEVRVIAAEDAMVSGPLKLEFVVIQAGEVVLRTGARS